MKTVSYKYSFSENANKLATLSPDGRVRVWEPEGGKLSCEWTPESSLQIVCSCLCWAYQECGRSRPKKESRKRSVSDHESKNNIGLGTLQGSVLLLDTDLLEVKNTLETGHSEKVNDVCFNSIKNTFYSGSSDKFIIEWSSPSMSIKSKWKADKQSITKLETSPDGSCLLTAGRSIKLWDLDTKQILQKFTGHANPVTSLRFVPISASKKYNEDCYFLSSAEEDHIINAWHFDPSCTEKGAVSCFMIPEEPVGVDLAVSDEQQLHLSVASLDGRVNLFKHMLNGKLTTPINSSMKFQLIKQGDEEKSSKSVRLLALKLLPSQASVLLVYGSPIKPTFEKLKLSNLENGARLVRKTVKNFLNEESDSKRIKKADTKSVVIDANAAINQRSVESMSRSTASDGPSYGTEPSLEERLQESDVATPPKSNNSRKSSKRPNAASLEHMLVQGIHCDDDRLIDNVLYKAKIETVVISTVRRLPSSSLMKVISKVVERIQRNPTRAYELTMWIRAIMNIHMTYLISIPNLMSNLSALYQTLNSRTKVYPKLSKLHGRLDLVLTQMTQRNSSAEFADLHKPLLSFEDNDESDADDTDGLSALGELEEDDIDGEDEDLNFDDSDDDDDGDDDDDDTEDTDDDDDDDESDDGD